MSVTALVGGQFGSEGKGLIAAHVARDYEHHVRVGAANAGHTLYTSEPWALKHVMQQIPCAAYANPDATLYIGPGAQISDNIFQVELTRLHSWRRARGLPEAVIVMDPRAHVITDEQIQSEAASGLAERIGSTSTIAREGIGAAQADRVMRSAGCSTAQSMYGDDDPADSGVVLDDVPARLHQAREQGDSILLEGTQGTGLSLTTGYFPYTTSRNTTAAGLCADAGVAPNALDRVILVCRTFPIRVAGNSGPFGPGSREIEWSELGIDPENERTTVTKKVRRVATFSMEQVLEAVGLNGATEIALTFADYLTPGLRGISGRVGPGESTESVDAGPVDALIGRIEDETGTPVRYVGTGPRSVIERV